MSVCDKRGHDFRPFDDKSLYCPRCGEFRTAPVQPVVVPYWPPITVPYIPNWPQWWNPNPLPWVIWSDTTSSDTSGTVYSGPPTDIVLS